MNKTTHFSFILILGIAIFISSQALALGKPLSITLAPGEDTGFVPFDGLTNKSMPKFVGTGPANVIMRIQANGRTICQTKSTLSGDFKCSSTTALADGTYTIKASQFGSPAFTTTSIAIDTVSSQPSTPDLDSSSDTGISDSDNITTTQSLRFSGTGGEPNALIGVIYDNGATLLCSAVVSSNGSYDCTGTVPTTGSYNFTSKQFDRAGNTSVSPSALSVTVN